MNTEEPNPLVIDVDDADFDSANPEILTVEEDYDDDEDVDVEIGHLMVHYVCYFM